SRLLGAARCPDLLLAVLDELAPHLHLPGSATTPAPLPDGGALSGREVQVLAAMARGRTNASIGSELGLSEDTVKTHARRLFTKLGARDRAHAVALGYQHDILGGAA
ncbi:helix-turn-helix domain-containing protein, partial [Pseudonocardia oceani]